VSLGAGTAGDRVVEQPTTGAQQRKQVRGVPRQHHVAQLLCHADARDRVIRPVVDVAVVLNSDLYAIAHTLIDRSAPGVVGLFAREGDADRLNPVVASSVAGQRFPSRSRHREHAFRA